MARKSRKDAIRAVNAGLSPEIAAAPEPASPAQVYRTAAYARLSVLETRGRKDNEALQNQKALLRSYIAHNPELRLCAEYEDNGETGTNFARSGFQHLLEDVRRGKINCIVVKDLSRFGRDHIEVGNYLEHIFPHLGVRFISVSDGYDSADASTFDCLTVALKNLVNHVYSKDISQKTGSVLREKQRRGEFIGAYASYGYLKDPQDRHRIIIDPETAPIVQEIYRRKLEGQSDAGITRWLNEAGILSPCTYRYQKGIAADKRFAEGKPWLIRSVKLILRSEVYLGHTVQGRRISEFYINRPDRYLPKEQWTVVRDTHAPLISQEDFDRVQEIDAHNRAAYHERLGKYDALGKTENILKGKVFCADCGRPLVRYKQVYNCKRVSHYYLCPNYAAQLERSGCVYKRVPESELLALIKSLVEKEIALAADLTAVSHRKASEHADAVEAAARERRTLNTELSRLETLKKRLMGDYLAGKLDRSDYERMKQRYQTESDDLKRRMEAAKALEQHQQAQTSESNLWCAAFSSVHRPLCLTKELAAKLIERITVYSNERIEVSFCFRDERRTLLESVGRTEAEAV